MGQTINNCGCWSRSSAGDSSGAFTHFSSRPAELGCLLPRLKLDQLHTMDFFSLLNQAWPVLAWLSQRFCLNLHRALGTFQLCQIHSFPPRLFSSATSWRGSNTSSLHPLREFLPKFYSRRWRSIQGKAVSPQNNFTCQSYSITLSSSKISPWERGKITFKTRVRPALEIAPNTPPASGNSLFSNSV